MSTGAWRTRLSLQNHKRKSPFESYFQLCFEALRLTNPLVTYCTVLIEAFSTWSCRVCLFEWTPYRNKRDSVTLKLHFCLKLLYLLLWQVVLWWPQMTQIDNSPVCSTCVFDTDGVTIFLVIVCLSHSNHQEQTYLKKINISGSHWQKDSREGTEKPEKIFCYYSHKLLTKTKSEFQKICQIKF